MKKISLFVLLLGFSIPQLMAQSFDATLLSKASSLLSSGDQAGTGQILSQVSSLLGKEAKESKTDFAPKLGNQMQLLNAVLPALSKGNADVSGVQKIIQTVSMLVGANGLSKLLGGGGGFASNAAALASNVGLLKSGLGALGAAKGVKKITKSLDKVTKKSAKLDMAGAAGKIAEKVISKKLTSSLGLLKGLI